MKTIKAICITALSLALGFVAYWACLLFWVGLGVYVGSSPEFIAMGWLKGLSYLVGGIAWLMVYGWLSDEYSGFHMLSKKNDVGNELWAEFMERKTVLDNMLYDQVDAGKITIHEMHQQQETLDAEGDWIASLCNAR